MESVSVLGVRIDNVTMAEVFERILESSERKEKLIVTPVNIRVVLEAKKNNELFNLLKQSHINTPDSKQIIHLLKLRNISIKERVTGADLFASFPAFAGEHGLSIGIFGGYASCEIARKKIESQSKAKVVFAYSPTPSEVFHTPQEIIEKINTAKPNVLFVALGCPKQELWILRNFSRINADAFVSIGAGIDFYAGLQKRAPIWMQKAGLEWMARLFANPKNMAVRYGREIRFYLDFLKETLRMK